MYITYKNIATFVINFIEYSEIMLTCKPLAQFVYQSSLSVHLWTKIQQLTAVRNQSKCLTGCINIDMGYK